MRTTAPRLSSCPRRGRTRAWTITLLRARAIENQCFVAAANAVGETGGETFGGCSAIYSPWGDALVEGSLDQPGFLTAILDLEQVEKVRQAIPVFQDRRPEVY